MADGKDIDPNTGLIRFSQASSGSDSSSMSEEERMYNEIYGSNSNVTPLIRHSSASATPPQTDDASAPSASQQSGIVPISKLSARAVADLARSNLEGFDLRARVLGMAERQLFGVREGIDGYLIPYYDITGKPIPYARARLFDTNIKYIQAKNGQNHIYFPKGFRELADKQSFIIFTEGEKKAATLVKFGFAACAASGVDSWRNRSIVLPKGIALTKNKNEELIGKLPTNTDAQFVETFAIGFLQLVEYASFNNKHIIIMFDSDYDMRPQTPWSVGNIVANTYKYSHKIEVQRAAAALGIALKSKGIHSQKIKQFVPHLPENDEYSKEHPWSSEKFAIDDYFTYGCDDAAVLKSRIEYLRTYIRGLVENTSANGFPIYPFPKDYVAKKLAGKPKRDEIHNIAFVILVDLDSFGKRMIDKASGNLYFFDTGERKLYNVNLDMRFFNGSAFANLLYKRYGIGAADFKVLQWVHTLFTGEGNLEAVIPRKLMFAKDDAIYYQTTDNTFIRITSTDVELFNNGDLGVLFESGQNTPIDLQKFYDKYNEFKEKDGVANFWYAVMVETRIIQTPKDSLRRILAMLFYISPWLYKWRNTQLPIELAFGEAGSGKSSLYELRMGILTGNPKLRNIPNDIKDWSVSVGAVGGLHIIDNAHMGDKSLRQQMSDEMCRIVTARHPSIESRKLYSNNELISIPVNCVFAITAVSMPFTNIDIMQRSVSIQFDKGIDTGLEYEMNWVDHQTSKFGGRESWLANHIVFLQRLLKKVEEKWNPGYKARFRLINLEQLLMLAAEIFDQTTDNKWIADTLEAERDEAVAEADWALQGFVAWAEFQKIGNTKWKNNRWTVQEIYDWAHSEDDYTKNYVFQSPRHVARYISANKNTLAKIVGLVEGGRVNNRTLYKLVDLKS